MHQDSKNLGNILRTTREQQNISLKDVENATSIRINFLTAIEEGNISKLISPVYARGFIKKYANNLGLDGDALIKDHPFVQQILNEQDEKNSDHDVLGVGTIEIRNSGNKKIKFAQNLALFILIIGAIIAFFTTLKKLNIF